MHPLLSKLALHFSALDPASFAKLGSSPLSQAEALELAHLPAADTLDLLTVASLARAACKPKATFTCGILNAKSGKCPENCSFCAQSAHFSTNAPHYPLCDEETLLHRAKALAEAGAMRFGVVTSGSQLSAQELDTLCRAAERITREVDIKLCGSLGQLTAQSALRLREAGFSSFHHNLETSASHFPHICTTHTYEEDLETVRLAQAAGLRICCGGIFGLGESWEQRLEFSATLAELQVDSIPINFLNAIPGTPLEKQPKLQPGEALRCIALMRLLHPSRDILICGGREHVLREYQSWLFLAGANGLMTGNYLTTSGNAFEADQSLMHDLGL